VDFHHEEEMQDPPGREVVQLVEVGVLQALLEDQVAEAHPGQVTLDHQDLVEAHLEAVVDSGARLLQEAALLQNLVAAQNHQEEEVHRGPDHHQGLVQALMAVEEHQEHLGGLQEVEVALDLEEGEVVALEVEEEEEELLDLEEGELEVRDLVEVKV